MSSQNFGGGIVYNRIESIKTLHELFLVDKKQAKKNKKN